MKFKVTLELEDDDGDLAICSRTYIKTDGWSVGQAIANALRGIKDMLPYAEQIDLFRALDESLREYGFVSEGEDVAS